MKRKKALRADPEKVRAWQRRSQEKARERAQGREGMASSSLRRSVPDVVEAAGGPLTPSTPRAKGNGLKRGPAADTAPGAIARPSDLSPVKVPFRAEQPANKYACARCEAARRVHLGRSIRATSWHHWLPQEWIREEVAAMRLEVTAAKKLLRCLLKDSRNLSALCWPCHDAGETAGDPFLRLEVPASAWEFARSFAGERGVAVLERLYRTGERDRTRTPLDPAAGSAA